MDGPDVSMVKGGAMMAVVGLAAATLTFSCPAATTGIRRYSPVVWKLNSLSRIGGLVPVVLGAPTAEAGGAGIRFDGRHDGLFLATNPIAGWRAFTIEALIDPAVDGAAEQRFLHIEDERGHRATLEIRLTAGGRWCLDTFLLGGSGRRTLVDLTRLHPAGRWTWVALRYDGRRMTSFVDGVKELEGPVEVTPFAEGRTALGVRLNRVYWYRGAIGEVHFIPRALEPADLQRAP
jgi:Concanavalin A-like lectin/glucanases superfamily